MEKPPARQQKERSIVTVNVIQEANISAPLRPAPRAGGGAGRGGGSGVKRVLWNCNTLSHGAGRDAVIHVTPDAFKGDEVK